MSDYYKTDKPEYEVINILQAKLTPEEFAGYLKGNVLKYIFRAGKKPDNPLLSDIKKAEQYLQWYKEHNEE